MKNKITKEKSSQKVAKFLEKNNLHKKDFAEMIGVTLSYVYNLIDETIPFQQEVQHWRELQRSWILNRRNLRNIKFRKNQYCKMIQSNY